MGAWAEAIRVTPPNHQPSHDESKRELVDTHIRPAAMQQFGDSNTAEWVTRFIQHTYFTSELKRLISEPAKLAERIYADALFLCYTMCGTPFAHKWRRDKSQPFR